MQGAWTSHQELNALDIHLLSHYLRSTCFSLANRHGNGRLWQTSVPRIAATIPFLRHGILALAALHVRSQEAVSGLEVDHDQLLELAHIHNDKAMTAFQVAIEKGPSTVLECHGIIAFIHCYTLYSFAIWRREGDVALAGDLFLSDSSRSDLEYLSPWLYYVRHGCELVCDFWNTIGNGPLAPLALSWDIPILTEDERSSKIAELLAAAIGDAGESRGVLIQAAEELSLAFMAANQMGEALTVWDAVRLWPLTLSLEFLSLLHRDMPTALILVACYCIILERLDALWFSARLSSTLLANIHTRLGERDRQLLQELRADILSILNAPI